MAETKTKATKKKAPAKKAKVYKAEDYVHTDWNLYRPKELIKVAHLGDGKILVQSQDGKVKEGVEDDLLAYEPVPPGVKNAF